MGKRLFFSIINTIKRMHLGYIPTVVLLIGCTWGTSIQAYDLPAGSRSKSYVGVEVADINREGANLRTSLIMDFSKVDLSGNTEIIITPKYIAGNDSVVLEPVTVAGRNRWYYLQRNNEATGLLVKGYSKDRGTVYEGPQSIADLASLQAINTKLKTYNYTISTPYRDWMENATFVVDTQVKGCANCPKGPAEETPMAQTDFVQRTFFPEFLYVAPVAEAIKMREISARAYIDFPVNRTEIYPDYRRNPEELAKIRATIDSVKNDKDINITSLHISGTASPEGGYQNNIRLAKGRTESLKDYVQSLYRFPAGFITTSFEPVDWKGLAEFLENVTGAQRIVLSSQQNGVNNIQTSDSIRYDQFQNIPGNIALWREVLPDAGKILAIVDSNIEPFERNNKIKFTYPEEYKWLLENVYPALRHSDYRIQFEIKTYTEVAEILEVMQTRPQNLSLAELFVAANSQEFGSPLYDQAFDLAVTMYPDDETANLNAGINAMRRGDVMSAEKYLPKAGNSPEADYARALLILQQGDTETGLNILRSLSGSLNPQVAAAAAQAVQGLEETAAANARTFVVIGEQ